MSGPAEQGGPAEGQDAVDPLLAAQLAEQLDAIAGAPGQPDAAAKRAIGERVRRVIDRLTATSAPAEVLAEAAGLLSGVVELLAPYDSVRRYEGVAEASGLGHDRAFFDWSPLLGLANPLAPPIRARVQDRLVVGEAVFGIAYEGPPGCVHGGYIAAAFDEMLGLTQSLSGKMGMTGTLSVKYRRPTPLNTGLRFECTVDDVSGRKVSTSGRLFAGESLTAEAWGLFITTSSEHFWAQASQRLQRGQRPG